MNILINEDEWLAPWVRAAATQQVKQTVDMSWNHLDPYVAECQQEIRKSGLITIDFKYVNHLIQKDLREFRNATNSEYKSAAKDLKAGVLENLMQQGVTDQDIINRYLNDSAKSFAKSIAPQLSEQLSWVIDQNKLDWAQPFFIRNILNNESLLRQCLQQKVDFWFIDTGYTNFLHGKNKVWHRMTHGHIHHCGDLKAYPEDRLHLLSNFPAKWRRKGSTILVVESSDSHYDLHGTTVSAWRIKVEQGIRAVSDRPIEFRAKNTDRKTRESVYELLLNSKDYYCVVSDSSVAAVEAIWTGTPVVTLEQHVTNSVSRQRLDQINNLYRGDLDQWFRMLSYNQFTFEELCDGTALSILREYGNV
jgi:hypothetical protein